MHLAVRQASGADERSTTFQPDPGGVGLHDDDADAAWPGMSSKGTNVA
jgi:hypothetical protein